jgi:hypothetical protein
MRTRYNQNFINSVKRLGGEWDGKEWVVPEAVQDKLDQLLQKWFGGERIAVRITAKDRIAESRGAVSFAGFTVARAWSRDSGAKLGDDVAMLEGAIASGGSTKNWLTVVTGGSVFVMSDFPKAVFDKLKPSEKWEFEIYTPGEGSDEDEEIEA